MSQKNPPEVKKIFVELTNKLQEEFKTNNMVFKEKYYQLTQMLSSLYQDVRECYRKITNFDQQLPSDSRNNFQRQQIEQYEPMAMVQFVQEICNVIQAFCSSFFEREQTLKKQVQELFKMGTNSNFLQVLAQKDLQNYDLKMKVQHLQAALQVKTSECKLAQKTTQECINKFKQYEKDYDSVMISAANLLKQSENYEMELRQENRLQKQLLQSHRIEFQRFKSDFKQKPTYNQKLRKMKQIMEKKYFDREKTLIRQTQKLVERRIKAQM